MSPYRYWRCPCSHCYLKRKSVLVRRGVNERHAASNMSQQPNYSQQSMSENSWELVNKAAAASTLSAAAAAVAVNAYNGYPTSAVVSGVGSPYHISSAGSSNGSHYAAGGAGAHPLQMSPTAAAAGPGNNSNSTVVPHWHGIRLPTAPSSSSSGTTVAAAAEQWLAASNHLQQQPQGVSGMNPSSTVIAPSSTNAAVAAAAAAQLYSGNTTSYFATGGGGGESAALTHPSLLPPTRPQPQGQQNAAAVVVSPTSPLISPTTPLAAASWPQSSRGDSILAKHHPHHFLLPQNHQSSEQRSPQQHHHNVTIVHGLNEKTSPHYQQHHHAQSHHQQYPAYSSTGSTTSNVAAVSSYEKLLEAVAIQARVPFMNQQQAAVQQPRSHFHTTEATGGSGDGQHQAVGSIGPMTTHHSSLLELDILRNLAATAGSASGGHNAVSAQHGQSLLPAVQAPHGATLGTNGHGGVSSLRSSTAVKQEPSYCDVTPPPSSSSSTAAAAVAMPSSELDVAHTMLSIQTCSIQNTVPEYQQISPAIEVQQETKYRPPSLTGSNENLSSREQRNGSGESERERKAYAAITVETAQSESDDLANQPSAKRLKICATSTEEISKEEEENNARTGDIADSNHSDASAQHVQTNNDNESDPDTMCGEEEKSKTPASVATTSHVRGGTEDVSPGVSRSSPSNDTPLTVGGRTDSSRSSNSESEIVTTGNGSAGVGATATATAVSFAILPATTSENASTTNTTATSSVTTTPALPPGTTAPGLVGPSPFGAFTAQQHAGNYAHLHTCHICGFTSPSKFHFNSHMNTHADHKCDYCDYTSRTEGRLKRHMKEFHSPRQLSGANSNDESSSHGVLQGGNAHFDQSLEEQLQAVVASMTAGASTSAGAFGNVNKTPPPSKASGSGSGNKLKTYRCKQCDFMAKSKDDYWSHSRTHIKSDKILTCPTCPFVTEYKHHMEYHLRNHFGSKPFKCLKCNYSCVNKSMLNSHMKSHSNFYQYRCSDCTYATKYCHSLKLHLRKYGHNAATTVTPDGGMVDGNTIDVYGNRRGPRSKRGGSDNGNRSSGEGSRSAVSTGGPMSASLPIASPSHLRSHPGSSGSVGPASGLSVSAVISESLNQHQPPTMVTQVPASASTSSPLMPAFVEALQSSLLAQQQKDLTAAMVTSIATLGAQLPTIPNLAAAIAAAHNQPGVSSAAAAAQQQHMANLARADSSSPTPLGGPGPISSTGAITPTLQLTSPPGNTLQSAQLMKCNLCDFACTSKETLTKHTMIHMIEKPEQLYHVYSLMASAAAQAQAVAAALATSQQSTSGSSSCGSTPVVGDLGLIKSESGGHARIGLSATPSGQYGGSATDDPSDGRFLLSHDASQDSGGSPGSVSGGKASGDEGPGNETFVNSTANSTGGGGGGHRQRRKGRAFKLDRIALKLQGKGCDEDDAESMTEMGGNGDGEDSMVENRANFGPRHTRSTSPAIGCYSNQSATGCRVNRSESVSSVSGAGRPNLHRETSLEQQQREHSSKQQVNSTSPSAYPAPIGRPTNIDWSNAYVCSFCEIAFKDCIMYTMHMGFHGFQDPYKCNTCGHVSDDPRSMFLHIAREPHL